MTSFRLACFLNSYSPDFSLPQSFITRMPPRNTHFSSTTPSRCSRSAISRGPTLRGMFTTRDCSSGPGTSNRCLPQAKAKPAPMAAIRIRVKMALPATTSGCRARREGRIGSGKCSGSNAVRGLRKEKRFSDADEPAAPAAPCEASGAYASTPGVRPAPVLGDGALRGSAVMAVDGLPAARYGRIWRKWVNYLFPESAKHQRSIGTAEAEGIREHDVDVPRVRPVRNQVHRGLHGGVVEVDGRRRDLVPNGQHGKDRFDGTRRSEQMTDRGLGGRHGNAACRIADEALHGRELDFVAHRRRGAVCVDVIEVGSRNTGSVDRHF